MGRKLAICLAFAGCTDALDVQSTAQPIVNGTIDMGDPATVYLDLGGGGCSGTLVTPKTIVTAKHCLSSSIDVFFGTKASGEGTWLETVASKRKGHPSGDIAMLTLAEDSTVAPFPMIKGDLAEHVGEAIRIAGFGVTSENGGGSGTKRQGMAMLQSLDGDIMYATNQPSGTCYGDSGGPNFMTIDGQEVLIGVTSFGTAACGSGLDGSVRIDTYRDWIAEYIATNDPASCDADSRCATGCAQPDPDCPCAGDGFCTAACGDIASDPDCAGCAADGMCRADCPSLDTDCCATDGTCNEACGATDADCVDDGGNPDNPGGEGGDADGDAGCSASSGGGSLLLLLALGMLLTRRRSGATPSVQ
jgi:MYXO-CTERM domain-containing protein